MQSIITRLDLSVETEFNDGLSGGVMERLPSVIALAGPNGAGKSRLLRRVRKLAQIIPVRRRRDTELAELNQQRLQRLSQSDERANKIARKMATVQSVDWDGVFESPIQVVDIDPLPRQLRSVADAKTSQVRDAGAPAPNGAFVLAEGAFWTIQSISNSYLSATHPKTKLNEIDRQWHTTRFADLNSIIRELLDTSLDPYAFDDPRLFERSLNASELSNGQQRLLAFAIAFSKAGDARTPKLVIMDEPESHLHPEAVIRVLERIKSLAGNVQIWLATHSLALLASLDPHSI
jgi:ABC-type phosphate transport system ATPase subunit